MTRPDLVIGGGLAGAGLAIQLARAGREVVLLERERGPHDKVCGEFLSYEAVDALLRLGVDPVALGAVPIDMVEVCAGDRRAAVALPFAALSLSRRVLDKAVLERAGAAGAEVRRGVKVGGLDRDGDGWTVRTPGGGMAGGRAFLATGKHDLRGWRRPPGRQPDLIGFKAYLPGGAPASVQLHLFPGGYAGLQPVEGERANLCLVVGRARFAALGGRWDGLVRHLRRHCPRLAPRLDDGGLEGAHPLAIAAIPYGHVQRAADGLWRLGDQAAVIPSFAGEGMAIALHSAELAAGFALAGRGADAYQRALARHVAAQVRGATWVSQALVAPAAQPVIGAALALAPGLASLVAGLTRLPARARPPAPALR